MQKGSFKSINKSEGTGHEREIHPSFSTSTSATPLRFDLDTYFGIFIEKYNSRVFNDIAIDLEDLKKEIDPSIIKIYSDLFEKISFFLCELYDMLINKNVELALPNVDIYDKSIDIHILDGQFSLLINFDNELYTYSINNQDENHSGYGKISEIEKLLYILVPIIFILKSSR